VLGNKDSSSRANRVLLRRRKISHTIPEPRDQQANRRRRGSRGGRPVGSTRSATGSATWSSGASASSDSGVGLASRYDKHAAITTVAYSSRRSWPGSDDPSGGP